MNIEVTLVLILTLLILLLFFVVVKLSGKNEDSEYVIRDILGMENSLCRGFERPKEKTRRKYKIISSFTSSPTRIFKAEKTLFSLKKQTYSPDYILLNVPNVFARTGETYYIPEFITCDKKIKINRLDRDYGPATKFVGAILRIPKDSDVWIVVNDDDQLYLQTTIHEYTKYIDGNNGNKKLCYAVCGFSLDENNWPFKQFENLSKMSVAEGFMTFCVHRSVFEDDFIPYMNTVLKNEDSFRSDDLILSNYLSKKGVEIYRVYNENINEHMWLDSKCELEYGLESDALHKMTGADHDDPLGGHHKKYIRVINWLKEHNLYYL